MYESLFCSYKYLVLVTKMVFVFVFILSKKTKKPYVILFLKKLVFLKLGPNLANLVITRTIACNQVITSHLLIAGWKIWTRIESAYSLLKNGNIPAIAMLVYQKGYREDHSPKHSMGRTVYLPTNLP